MITLNLSHAAAPDRTLETRNFADGEIIIGRDPGADWRLDDPECELSRRHCLVRFDKGVLYLKDLSANGVFLGAKRRRLVRDQDVEIAPGEPIFFGKFMVTATAALPAPANDHDGACLDAPFHSPMLQEPVVSEAAYRIQSAWQGGSREEGARQRLPDAALLEAFCEGAGLDPSMFAAEDPAEVLRRAGAIYQQAVLGLSDLMGERTSLKSAYRMARTTVSSADNNPFKWADAHRVAVDLLKSKTGPFLGGASAVTNSFQDLKKHVLCLMAGSRAAVAAALDELEPIRIEQEAPASLLDGKAQACWREYRKRHEEISSDAHKRTESAINLAFKSGYEREVRKLDELGTRS